MAWTVDSTNNRATNPDKPFFAKRIAGVWRWFTSGKEIELPNYQDELDLGVAPAALSDLAESRLFGRAVGAGTGPAGALTPAQSQAILGLGRSRCVLSSQGAGAAGWGSSSTKIALMTADSTVGADATGSNSATLGSTITINTTGLWYLGGLLAVDGASKAYVEAVLSLDAVDFTTDPLNTDLAGTVARMTQGTLAASEDGAVTVSRILVATAGQVLRLHGRGSGQVYTGKAYLEAVLLALT